MKIVKLAIITTVSVVIVGCCFFVNLTKIDNNISEYSLDGDGSLQVYLVNLDKSTDRLENIKPLIEKLDYPYERISAVYGKELSQDYIKSVTNPEKYKILMHNEIGVGTIGCFLSHIKLWTKFLQSSHSYALVLEDDVEFEPRKLNTLINLLINNSTDWDLVNIDVNRYGFVKPVKKLSRLFRLVQFRVRVGNTSCYLINRKAALSLLKRAFPIAMPVDHYMMRSWELGLNIRGVNPQVVHQSFGDSEIKSQEFKKNNISIFYKVSSLLYQITADFMTFIKTIS